MRSSGVEPNGYTFVTVLTACVRLLDLELGSQVHALAVKTGHVESTYVANALMGLYGKCGCLDCVVKLFSGVRERDTVSWNTVISCLVNEGVCESAFDLFRDVLRDGECGVDYFTLSTVLVACARCRAKMGGEGVHALAVKIGCEGNLSVKNALIEFYSKCGCVEDVEMLFGRMPVRDFFTWTGMIGAYMGFELVGMAVDTFDRMPKKNCVTYNALFAGFCKNGEGFRALELFCRIVEDGVELNDFTLTHVLKACGLTRDSRICEQIQAFVVKISSGTNDCIVSALLDMCTRCARMDDAEKIFHQLPLEEISSVALTTLACGYARNSEPEKAISGNVKNELF